jgi:predicted dehydrogenase
MKKAKLVKRQKTYGLAAVTKLAKVDAPLLDYRPRLPVRYRPKIGLIGCGGITQTHLRAYRRAGLDVVALCDVAEKQASARAAEFYPRAVIYTDYRKLLACSEIEVVDIATHPEIRGDMIEAAIRAGKHVLSQKPFVLDLDKGEKLVRLAEKHGVKLAVNQNGRWAPHFSYLRQAVAGGYVGDLLGVHFALHWDHSWIGKTAFNGVKHAILFDFAIHWFDMMQCLMGDRRAEKVFASFTKAEGQTPDPALLAQVQVQYGGAQASMVFDAFTRFGPVDRTDVIGTKGTLYSLGPDLNRQRVTLHRAEGISKPRLRGKWFPDGFLGTMGELLCAIEEKREASNSARKNLKSLALCFAAIASAESGKAIVPGKVRRLPG